MPPRTELVGTDPATARTALARRDPLPGTPGFAGALEGRLVRDVLGRQPLFSEAGQPAPWSRDPADLEAPERVPAGHVRTGDGDKRVWSLPELEPDRTATGGVRELRAALDETLAGVGSEELAVAFSGGVDSALLAARLNAPLYTVGFPDSHDLGAARSGARALGREVRTVELDHETLETTIPEVARATGQTNAMDVAIALPLSLVAERAAADGYSRLAVGQGADELFGGYAKVVRAPEDPRVAAGTVRGARREVVQSLPDQLERDTLVLRAAGVEPVAPFVHDRVVSVALGLPGESLVSERGDRKWAFRLAARAWLPDRLAFREKKALQYGTLVSRELDRLARQAGYKQRMDSHVRRYVESRLA
jgi:asparagine synthase (glutamine-hydrolysing)